MKHSLSSTQEIFLTFYDIAKVEKAKMKRTKNGKRIAEESVAH